MQRTLIFAALRWECRCVLRALRHVSRHRYGPFTAWHGDSALGEVVVVKTGVGLLQAQAAVRAVDGRGRFDLYISTGCAGALAPDLGCGDAVLASELVDGDGGHWPVDDTVRRSLWDSARRAALHTVVGPVLCSSRALATAEEKRGAAERTGTVAVEMEGIALAAHAAERGRPFVSTRVVLDGADTNIDASVGLVDHRTGDVKPFAVARSLVTGKSSWSSLLGLRQMVETVESSLNRLFAVYLTSR